MLQIDLAVRADSDDVGGCWPRQTFTFNEVYCYAYHSWCNVQGLPFKIVFNHVVSFWKIIDQLYKIIMWPTCVFKGATEQKQIFGPPPYAYWRYLNEIDKICLFDSLRCGPFMIH